MSGGGPAPVVLGPVSATILPPPSVRAPPPLPVSKEVRLVLVAVAVGLLPVVVVPITPLWGPPVVQRLVILVLAPLPEARLWVEGASALSVAGVKAGGREGRVRRVVHGVGGMVAHGLRGHWGGYWWVRQGRRSHWGHHVGLVGVLSRQLGSWWGACTGKRWRREVGWGVREALAARRLDEGRARPKRTGGLGRWRRGVLHEVGVGGHVATVAVA